MNAVYCIHCSGPQAGKHLTTFCIVFYERHSKQIKEMDICPVFFPILKVGWFRESALLGCRLFNPILHTSFRDTWSTCDGSSTIKVSPSFAIPKFSSNGWRLCAIRGGRGSPVAGVGSQMTHGDGSITLKVYHSKYVMASEPYRYTWYLIQVMEGLPNCHNFF